MLSSGSEKKPTTRRVPDAQRRRTLVSCDRCKTRRIRCCRSNEAEPCTNCLAGGVKCESTLPRKQRVYGSVERFSLRYRALDALVRGLFPSEDTKDVKVLFRLAQHRNIPMPSPDDESPIPEAFSQSTSRTIAESVICQPGAGDYAASEVVFERMIPGPRRILHYVGPSSSSEFASIIRHLVTKFKKLANTKANSYPHALDHSYGLTAPDTEHHTSQTTQRTGQAHSFTPARNEDRQTETGNLSRNRASLQGQATLPTRKQFSQDPSANGERLSPNLQSPLKDLLPDRVTCDALVKAYLDHLHGSFQVFFTPIFQHRYNSLWDSNIGQTGASDVGWTCCLFMVIILGADVLGPGHCPNSILIQTKYMKLVRESFQSLVFNATLENVQALILLQLYEQNSGERNTSWLILGLAVRMAITLGMHREGTYASFDEPEACTRRVVWWTLFQMEYNMSMILGRPPTINAKEVNVALPGDDVLDGAGYPHAFDEYYLKLTGIGDRVRRLITTVTPKFADEPALLRHEAQVKSLLQELEAWKSQLPHHIASESLRVAVHHRRAVILLQAIYHHHRCVLTRAFVACKSNRNIDRLPLEDSDTLGPVSSITESYGVECRNSAIAVLDCFLQLSKEGLLEGVAWIDFYYICHGVLVLGLFELGRMHGSRSDAEHDLSSSKIAEIESIINQIRLAPTYKIFTKVSLGFAKTVGLGVKRASPTVAPAIPTGDMGAQVAQQQLAQPSTLDFPFTSAPNGQVPWSTYEMNSVMPPPTTENTMSPPGLLGWFWREANSGTHMSWDMFNLGNIQLSGADYMETPPHNVSAYPTPQQFEH